MSKVGLISCTKRKYKERMMASDIYEKSSYFRKQKKYVKQECDRYFIASAKYYILSPHTVINYYNQKVNNPEMWGEKAFKQLQTHLNDGETIVITAGKDYTKGLVPRLKDSGYTVELPLEGLKMGPSQAKLNELTND